MRHAADNYRRIDIRQSSRNLVVRNRDCILADTRRPLVLYESGFAPRWYAPRADIDESALASWTIGSSARTKGCAVTTTSGEARSAVWSYREVYTEVSRIDDLVSFEPDIVPVQLDEAADSITRQVRRDLDIPITNGKQT